LPAGLDATALLAVIRIATARPSARRRPAPTGSRSGRRSGSLGGQHGPHRRVLAVREGPARLTSCCYPRSAALTPQPALAGRVLFVIPGLGCCRISAAAGRLLLLSGGWSGAAETAVGAALRLPPWVARQDFAYRSGGAAAPRPPARAAMRPRGRPGVYVAGGCGKLGADDAEGDLRLCQRSRLRSRHRNRWSVR